MLAATWSLHFQLRLLEQRAISFLLLVLLCELMKVIKGWTEAMQLMVEGDKWEMYIPSELGYGDLQRRFTLSSPNLSISYKHTHTIVPFNS